MFKNRYLFSNGKSRKNLKTYRHSSQPKVDVSLYVKKGQDNSCEEVYIPKHKFADFEIQERIKMNVREKGYETPTPIQDQAIPHILRGEDIIGIANTGTGKTATFLIPLINKIHFNRNQKVLIVVPTRELAQQIYDEFKVFANNMNMYATLCIGGASINVQTMFLRRNPNFVIGTPGRLKDLIERRVLYIQTFNNIVLDEVDRMLDMGFIRDVKYLISLLPRERQSMFFAATVEQGSYEIIHSLLKNPVTVSVKKQETCAHIEQDVIYTNGKNKPDILHDLLIRDEYKKVLVFVRTKYGVEKLGRVLNNKGLEVATLHSNKTQGQRVKALQAFKQDQVRTLLATDVASRGLDIDDVTHVINYDLPGTYQDYIHRIGRTGRANKKGTALTFID